MIWLKYLLKKLIYSLAVLFGVALLVFFLFHALPGDPVSMMAGQRSDVAAREVIAEDLGLHDPLHLQLYKYLKDLSPLSIHPDDPSAKKKYNYHALLSLPSGKVWVIKKPYLRRSFQSNKRVTEILMENIEGTFWLAIAAMAFATVAGIVMGVIAAIHQNTFWDHFYVTLSIAGISVPTFVAAILMALVFGYYLSDYTGLNLTGQLWVTDPMYGRQLQLKNIILPALTLGFRPLAIIAQLTRNSMLEIMDQDYIRTARAKGLSEFVVVWKHGLKNAINPVITAISGWLASLMAGAFFVEYIFGWKGIGAVTIKAVQHLDLPVVMGSTLMIALFFVLINIVVDIFYAIADPRIRLNT
ncbi:MAG: ABC transporter permease [Cyclobacteriaceae bacterium]|nr:ABC transporter permease [Cyclobacteriaceae bacterium]